MTNLIDHIFSSPAPLFLLIASQFLKGSEPRDLKKRLFPRGRRCGGSGSRRRGRGRSGRGGVDDEEAEGALLDVLRQFFLLSEDFYTNDTRRQYTVVEPRPFHYALKASKAHPRGAGAKSAESETFTDDHLIAKTAAEFFTRNSLSPIHLEAAIEDYINSI